MVRYFLLDLTDLTINGYNLQKFNDQHFQRFKNINDTRPLPFLPPPHPRFEHLVSSSVVEPEPEPSTWLDGARAGPKLVSRTNGFI